MFEGCDVLPATGAFGGAGISAKERRRKAEAGSPSLPFLHLFCCKIEHLQMLGCGRVALADVVIWG